MNVDRINGFTFAGSISLQLSEKVKGSLIFNPDLSREELKKKNSRIYLLVVDGEIKKIGGSADKAGILGTIRAYCSGNTGSPSDRTFGINRLIQNSLKEGKKVTCYVRWIPQVKTNIFGILDSVQGETNISFKACEDRCIEQYREMNNGKAPDWNYKENGESFPVEIIHENANQKLKRGENK